MSDLFEAAARASLRPHRGTVAVDGLTAPIEIHTDQWGVPHAFAASREDMWFAQGWLHGAERGFQLELLTRTAQGRLAEWFGASRLPSDRFHRTIGLHRLAEWSSRDGDLDTIRIGNAYVAGVRAATGAVSPVEYTILGTSPHADDLVALLSRVLLFAFQLSRNWDTELLRHGLAEAVGPERAGELTPTMQPGLLQSVVGALGSAGGGSNNWVVSGTQTVSGKPLLASDPHLMISAPSTWMEMHLACPDMEVTGASLVGMPGIVIGHSRSVAWGVTNTGADVVDLFHERLSENGDEYENGGTWTPVEHSSEQIPVLGSSPAPHAVRRTSHGPLLELVSRGVLDARFEPVACSAALRWALADVPMSLGGLEAMNAAGDAAGFREALRRWPLASWNFVFADTGGDVGYQCTGRVPIRRAGNGSSPAPGWTNEHEWVGTIPFDELPSLVNPQEGWIATANNDITPPDYVHHLSVDWEPPYRVDRIAALLRHRDQLTLEDMAAIQLDTYSLLADSLLPQLLASSPGPGESEALSILRRWDRKMSVDSIAASIFVAWLDAAVRREFGADLSSELFSAFANGWSLRAFVALTRLGRAPAHEALGDACTWLAERLGPDPADWEWGRLHKANFVHPLARDWERLSAGSYAVAGGADTVNVAFSSAASDHQDAGIPGYRVLMDVSDWDRCLSSLPPGNSGNPLSPHWADQAAGWARGAYHAMPFSRTAVETVSDGRLRLINRSEA